MNLFAKALLTVSQKEEIIEWVTSVKCYRNNNYTIDNVNKILTIYKKHSSSGALYHLDFLPIVIDGYEPVKPKGISYTGSNESYYWRIVYSDGTDENGEYVILEYNMDIVKTGTTEAVVTYKLILDFTKEAP
jgi:hypothetical protein